MTCGARARIRLEALQHNLERIRTLSTGCKVMAAIKGNAYGHGLVPAARQFAGADSLAVARLAEAEALRERGIAQPLVLLGGVADAAELRRANACGVEWVLHSRAQLALLEQSGVAAQSVWLKVDTGMHRLGFSVTEAPALINTLMNHRSVARLGLMTHLATADDPADALTAKQEAAFQSVCRGFRGDVSIANSPALFGDGAGRGDSGVWGNDGDTWVRPGIALYGISPFATGTGSDLGLQAAMAFESRLLDVKDIEQGERVGYGGRWIAAQRTRLGIVAAGYGDGYSRCLPSGTPVLVNGRRVPLAGTVSMDLATVDLGAGADDKVGDRVTLWGEDLPVEDVARAAGTIPYQLVTGLLHREAPLLE